MYIKIVKSWIELIWVIHFILLKSIFKEKNKKWSKNGNVGRYGNPTVGKIVLKRFEKYDNKRNEKK